MRRSWSRGRLAVLVASTAVAAVTIAGNPAVASAAPPAPSTPRAASAPAADPAIVPASARPAIAAPGAPSGAPAQREVVRLRTESSRTVEVPGGGYRTTVSSAPVHYRDAGGAWQPIDTTLVGDGAVWRPKAAGWTAELPATLGSAPVKVGSGSRWVTLAPTGAAAVAGVAKGSRITYPNAFPGVSLVYDALPTGLKESIVLSGPKARTSFSFAVRASAGLTATAKDGAIRVTDAAGATVFGLPAGFLTDEVDGMSGRTAVGTTLASAASLTAAAGAGITLTAAPSWLTAPGRRWPVVLDPTVVIGPTQITDCHLVDGAFADVSHCNSDFVEVGYGASSQGSVKRRTLMKFDVASIPQSAVIKDADLKLIRRNAGQVAATFPVQLFRNARDWNTSATWNSTGLGGDWAPLSGGLWGPTQIDKRSVDNQAAEVHFYPAYLVQLWVQKTSLNQGLLLKSENEATVGHARFASSSDPVVADRPSLSVDWTVQHGQRDTNTFVTKKLTDRCEAGANVANGNLMVRCTEFSIGGVGQSVEVSRYYNSGNGPIFPNRADSPLGINRWQLSTGVYLAVRQNSVEFHDGSGSLYPFHQLGGTGYRQAPGLGATLQKDQPAAGQYRLKFHKSGAQYVFKKFNSDFYNITWQLWKIIDRNGNTTEFSYTDRPGFAEGALSTIKDTRGRVLTAGYVFDAGSGKDFLKTLTDSTGRVVTYAYTGWSLTAATDTAGKTTTYGYQDFGTSNQQLSTFTDPRGNSTQFGYDTNGRVLDINQHPASGLAANTHLTYNDTVTPPTTTVRDPNNNNTVYEIQHKDYASRVTKATDAKGKQRSRSFTSNAQVGSSTDEFGTTTNTWDQNLADADSADSGESLTKSVGPTGSTSLSEYKSATGTACPTGAAVSGDGYNSICSRDHAGNRSSYTYDGPGNRSASKNALAATAKVDRAVNGSSYTPTDGRVVKATDPLGRVTTYNYADVTFNAVTTKRLSSITAPGGSLLGVRTVTYDALDRLRTNTIAGRTTVVTRSYDGADRLTSVTYNDSTPALTYVYDANGNMTGRTVGTATTTFAYDWMNRPTSKTLPGGTVLGYTYDLVGNLKTSTQAGDTTTYDYDTVNQVVKMTERSDRVTRFAYRADGKRTDTWYAANLTDPPSTFAAHIHTDFTNGGQVSRIKTTRASSDADANRVKDYSFCYRPRSVTGATCTTAKDETNDRSKIQWVVNNIGGNALTLSYDGAGRLTQKADIGGGTTSTSTYDSNGNRTSEKETNKTDRYFGFTSGNAMCWTASVAGSSTGCTPPAGAQTTWTYDESGNQTVNPDFTAVFNGTEQTTSVTKSGVTTPFGYAADNQTERTSTGGTTYVNGLLGLQSETTGGQTTYYERDPSGQLISERTPSGDYYYVFDQNGSVLALIDAAGQQRASYSYSPWGEDRGTVAVNGALPANPYRFAGQYLDSSTGLYKMGLRYYDPKFARWTQQDSIESIGDPSNGNRYAYAGDDPINNTDPSGASYVDFNVGFSVGLGIDVGVQIGEDGISPYAGFQVGTPGPSASVQVSDTVSSQSGGWASSGQACFWVCPLSLGKDNTGDGAFAEAGVGSPSASFSQNFYLGPYDPF